MKASVIPALCAITFLLVPNSLHAEEPATPAIRLLQKMDFEKTAIESAGAMFEPMMDHFVQLGLPEEALQEIRSATEKFMNDIFSDPAIFQGVAAIYENHFTAAELEELILFYESPLGRKTIAAQPTITQATAELTMKTTMENQEMFQKEITRIMEKYKAAVEAQGEADDTGEQQ